MRIAVIGATGLIGSAVAAACAEHHEVVTGSRSAGVHVDIGDPGSIRNFFGVIGEVDAVICCAGRPRWGPMADLTEADYAASLNEKLLGQIGVVRSAIPHLRDAGVIVLTAGLLARHPMVGSTAPATVNAALEGFARAASLELPRGIRIAVVSPGWVGDPEKLDRPRTSPETVARAYLDVISGVQTNIVVSVGQMDVS